MWCLNQATVEVQSKIRLNSHFIKSAEFNSRGILHTLKQNKHGADRLMIYLFYKPVLQNVVVFLVCCNFLSFVRKLFHTAIHDLFKAGIIRLFSQRIL